MSFNGGKQYHIFNIQDNIYKDEFTSEESKEAFENGIFYTKIDGANGYHLDGILYERYDDKKNILDPNNLPDGIINIPVGENPCIYEGHHYYYSKMDSKTTNKKLKKVYEDLYYQLNTKKEKNGSVEFVGPNFQLTPRYNNNKYIFHQSLSLNLNFNRNFKNIKNYLNTVVEEGVVIEYKGKYWKIRSNLYDNNCKFDKLKKSWINWKKGKSLKIEEIKLLNTYASCSYNKEVEWDLIEKDPIDFNAKDLTSNVI